MTAVLAVAGAALALRLEPSADTDSLVKNSEATDRYHQVFGDEPIIVLVQGDLQRTVLTEDLARLTSLEGCLSGNAPTDDVLSKLPPVCREIAKEKFAKVVYGPGTFINTAANQIAGGFEEQKNAKAREAAEAANAAEKIAASRGYSKARQKKLGNDARQLVYSQFVQDSLRLALRYGLTSVPSIDNVDFVSQLVFDPRRGVGTPKARFAYLFPGKDSAVVQVRLKPNLTDKQKKRAIALTKKAVADPAFKLRRADQRYVVSGLPVVVDGLAREVQRSIFVLLLAALLVMAGTLALVFRTRLRLLPLGVALVAAALTFGAVSLAGGSLTMASIAGLPVLIGLAVDYAIQFQARFDEREERDPAEAAANAAAAGGPTIAAAGIATAVGFLVLLLSPVPMVRGFGVLLVVGIAIAFLCAITAGFAALVYAERRPVRPAGVPPPFARLRARTEGLRGRVADLWDRAAYRLEPVADFARRAGRASLAAAVKAPRMILLVGIWIALLGWVADTQTAFVSDVRELVPQNLQELKDVQTLQDASGVSGEIDVTIRGEDLTDPKNIAWMTKFQSGVLAANGYKAGKTCNATKDPPELCPALSLPDLFRTGGGSEAQINELLAAIPPYFSQAVISPDRKTANLAFGVRLQSLERQQEVIDDIKRRLNPPAGVKADVTGLPVQASEANAELGSTWRRALTLFAALLAVFLVLLAVRRKPRLAAVPLIPIALASGWSSLMLFVLQIPINPMSATLAALVIAISTEFAVLLSARYDEERQAGFEPREALERTYASTGAAVFASGATAIAGFAALIASDIKMLRDFGFVTVIDLTVALLGVMVVLPAALMWAEQHERFRLADFAPRELWADLRAELGRAPAPLRAQGEK
ncbi:MAG: MMPL family transporter, partial [Thermoleophilaceae bacterium]|nr:MMPL family transporter [Thermoleophilaceae bacterium]